MPKGTQHIVERVPLRTSSFLQPGAVVRCFVAFFLAFSLFPTQAFAADANQVLTTSPAANPQASSASSAATSANATAAATGASNAANTTATHATTQASASPVVTETITLGTEPLNLIQNGNYNPTLTPAISSAYATSTLATAPTATQRNQIKARLNTALMNVNSSTYNRQSDWCVVDVKDLNAPLSTNGTAYAKTIIDEVINENPDLFYAGQKEYGGGTSTSGSSTILSKILVRYSYAPSTIKNTMKPKYESAMQTMLGWVNANKSYKNSTDAEKAKAVHDWLVRNCLYNTNARVKGGPKGYGSYDPWTAYGAVVTKSPVCEGYSLAFMSAMGRLGIQASFVQNADHGWNRVRLKVGSSYYWYNLDVTWDDPLKYKNDYADGGYNTTPSTKYFLKSDAAMKKLDTTHAKWAPTGTAGTNTAFDSASWNTTNASSTSAGGVYPLSSNTHTVTSFSLSPAIVQLKPDASEKISIANVSGTNVVVGMAKWTSSNPAVASVSADGTVTSGKEMGTATITVTLGGKTATCRVQVSSANSINHATITRKSATYEYKSGVPWPNASDRASWATVKVGSTTLKNGTDYTITWPSDMINPGVKTVTFTGKGKYGGTVTTTYTVRCSLSKVEKSATSFTVTYNGSAQKKLPTLTFKGSNNVKLTLKEGTDFSVSWPSDMTNPGTKKVTITGKGAWTGTFTYNVVIKPGKSAVWNRLWGQTEFDTMQQIIKAGWNQTGGTVIIATSGGFADALSAAGVAGLSKAPVLLVKKNQIPTQTRAELQRLKPKTVIIAGGPGAISNNVSNQIKSITSVTPKRIYGQTATGTAAALNTAYARQWADSTAILATSKSFYDALSVAPISYAKHYPIFLAENKNSVSSETIKAMKACGIKRIIIVGGTGAISNNVVNTLKKNGISLKERLWGQTEIDTSKSIANWGIKNGMSVNNIGIATSKNYYDALCGAALCGKNNAVLVLTSKNNTSGTSVVSSNKRSIVNAYVFGGTGAVSAAEYNKFVAAAK